MTTSSGHQFQSSRTADLCAQCTQAEYAGRLDDARLLSLRAWESAADDLDACLAAHYVARYEPDPVERLRWNEIALEKAEGAPPERIVGWLPSLCVNLGRAHEALGHEAQARHYFAQAAELGLPHAPDGPDRLHSSP